MQNVLISTGSSYTVSIGSGLLSECGTLLQSSLGLCKSVIITDSTVGPLYAATVEESLTQAGYATSIFTFEAGEGSKRIETLSAALEFLATEQLTRADCVIALGGGVVGDLSGLAAGCYLRGIRYVQMPTTLLAAVDSSVGGKTAINLTAGKNLAGMFWQPSAVLCDTDCLHTLPEKVFLDGVAEGIKTGVLEGEGLFSLFEHGDILGHIEEIVTRCVAFKAHIVEADERESGLRKVLNLGHTIGHAVEASSNYTISHGHAVAIGLAMITRFSTALGLCDTQDARRIIHLLSIQGLPVHTDFTTGELMKAILHDKKCAGDSITLILPEGIGSCIQREFKLDVLPTLLEEGRGEI